MKRLFDIKPDVRLDDLMWISPHVFSMLATVAVYCSEFNLPFIITSLKEDAKGRVSNTHKTGRAADISIKEWPKLHIYRLRRILNKRFKEVAAKSASDNKPRAAIVHSVLGSVEHMHVQSRF